MKHVAVFHANLNYAYVVPERYEFVTRSSYELLIETMRERFANTQYVFEASGYTLAHTADMAVPTRGFVGWLRHGCRGCRSRLD